MANRRRRWRRSNGPRRSRNRATWRPRNRATGCLLLVVGLIIVLVILSLLFGGFQMGTKADGPGIPAPATVHVL
jgi:hypothetical protein